MKIKILIFCVILIIASCSPINRVYISNYTDKEIVVSVRCQVRDFDIKDINKVNYNDSVYSSLRTLNIDWAENEFSKEVSVVANDGKSYRTILKSNTTTWLLPTDSYTPIENVQIGDATLIIIGSQKNIRAFKKADDIEISQSRNKGTLIKILK